jgi:hypothetical protein
MTLFDAPRTFISLCINMSNMVLEHVGGAARHCIVYVHSFVFPPSCHRFLSGVVGHCGFLEMKKLAWGICGMHRDGALRDRTADWFEDGTRAV